ncbi:MAG TPA: hypothetical protein VFH51_13185, partial [Myxococcota bacterium]|nr:hypothetical protein [Myxococcota bacterium]
LFPQIGLEKLVQHGIGEMRQGSGGKSEFYINREAWYSQAAWLKAFEGIASSIGVQVLFKIGKNVPKHAVFPPQVKDIHAALQSLDVAYHMNHRKGGHPMFNYNTGHMMEGIGHYKYEKRDKSKEALMVCENPYPCDFDRGVIQGLAERFEAQVKVAHDTGPCRKKGENSCRYVVTW